MIAVAHLRAAGHELVKAADALEDLLAAAEADLIDLRRITGTLNALREQAPKSD